MSTGAFCCRGKAATDPMTDEKAGRSPETSTIDAENEDRALAVEPEAPKVATAAPSPPAKMEDKFAQNEPVESTKPKITGSFRDANKSGLSSDHVKRVAEIESEANEKIAKVDEDAIMKIAAFYEKGGVELDTSSMGKQPGHVSVVGAASKAEAAGLAPGLVKKIANVEKKAKGEIEKIDAVAVDKVATVYKEEGVEFKRPGFSGRRDSSTGIAAATGLSSSAVGKVAVVEEKASQKIKAIDEMAMKKISAVYRKNDVPMEERDPQELSVHNGNVVSGSVAVVGAGGAAAAAGLKPRQVAVISSIEKKSVKGMQKIDNKASNHINSIYKKEKAEYQKPAVLASPAAGAAASAGLSMRGQEKVVAIETKTRQDVTAIDTKALGEVNSVYRANGLEMQQPTPGRFSNGSFVVAGAVGVAGAAAIAANAGLSQSDVDKIAEIENKAIGNIQKIDDKATKQVAAAYKKEKIPFEGGENIVRPDSPPSSPSAVATATGAAALAAASGLSSSGVKKVQGVEKKAAKNIGAVDKKATSEIASIYKANGLEMDKTKPPVESNKGGPLALGALAITGAAAAAAAANMSSTDVNKVAAIEEQATQEIAEIESAAEKNIMAIYEKEGVEYDTRDLSEFPLASAASAAGLSLQSQRSIAMVEQSALDKIEQIDDQAVAEAKTVYGENRLQIDETKKETTLGTFTAMIGIAGVSGAAASAGMGSLDLAKVSDIEEKATNAMKSVDKHATDEIAATYEAEGKWFSRPGSSRAAASAAAAGLALASVKKIAEAVETAEQEIDEIDNKTAAQITEADKAHAVQMHKSYKEGTSETTIAEQEIEAMKKYKALEEVTLDKIAIVDERTEDQVAAIYKESGESLHKSNGFFTERGENGASATAAAIGAAATGARQRKQIFGGNGNGTTSRGAEEEPDVLSQLGTGAHLAIYDVGATIAKAGTAITGTDFEGPAEYDARADYTPEQRARCC